MKNVIFLLMLCTTTSIAQNISLIQDLRTGPESGVASGSTMYNDEFYFVGQNDGPSLNTVFSIDQEGVIRERITAEGFLRAQALATSGDYLYAVFTTGLELAVYRTTGVNGGKELVYEPEGRRHLMVPLENGIAFIEENDAGWESVTYIPNDLDSIVPIVKDIIGFPFFFVTESARHIFLSPNDDDQYSGPLYVIDKTTMRLDTSFLPSVAPNIKYAYGEGDYLVYSDNDEYYVYNYNTSTSSASLGLLGRRPAWWLEEKEDQLYFLYGDFGGMFFYTISKDNFSITKVTGRVDQIHDLTATNGKVYYTENHNAGVLSYVYDSSSEGVTQISTVEKATTMDAIAVLDDEVYIIGLVGESVFLEGGVDYLSVVNGSSLDTMVRLSYPSSIEPFLASSGDKLYFSNRTDELGVELYSFSKSGVNVEDQNQVKLSIYPNPTSDGHIYFQERVEEVSVTDVKGKLIFSDTDLDHIAIDESGVFIITGRLYDGSLFTRKVVVR